MQLRYGGYRFAANAVAVATTRETIWDDLNNPVAVRNSFAMQGRLEADGQAAITAACALLETALAVPFQDLVMARDDGGVAFALANATSLSGVRVSGPNYPTSEGNEYGQYRTFSFSATADYPTGFGSLLVSFRETVTFHGGGPLKGFLEPVNGLPIRQVLKLATPFYAEQTGESAALKVWPVAPAPLWPAALLESPNVTFTSPARQLRGVVWPISWAYRFGSTVRLSGRPHVLLTGGAGGGGG